MNKLHIFRKNMQRRLTQLGVRKLLCKVQSHIFRWLEFHIDSIAKVNHQMV